MTFDGRTATSLVMLALFAGGSVMALSLPQKAAFMPLLVGVPGTLLCLWQVVADLRRPRGEADPAPADTANGSGRSEAEVFAWLALFTIAIVGFGFLVGGTLVVAAFVRFSSRESWRNALFAGVGTFLTLYGVFNLLLELSLFPGLVLQRIL